MLRKLLRLTLFKLYRLMEKEIALIEYKRNLETVAHFERKPYINPRNKTKLTKNTYLGKNVNLNGLKIRGYGKVVIGDNFHSGGDILIITRNHNYDKGKSIPYDETYITKDVTIEDNVWVGSRSIIIGSVTIGEGAIIQAGSVVLNDIPKYAIAGGHPAKVFKYRDIEHYNKLKKEGKFH